MGKTETQRWLWTTAVAPAGETPSTESNDLEQKKEINIHPEEKEETKIQKNKERLKNLWDNLKCSNIWIKGVPEGEEQQQKI